jgi:xanthine dehydrogenase accessory factor
VNLRQIASTWWAEGRSAVIVEVLAHRGSVPRETGTRMLVGADAVAGTIGGGHLELEAIRFARAGRREPWAVALGPGLGQCCGGALTLGFLPLDNDTLAAWHEPEPRFHLELYGAGHVGRAIERLLRNLPCHVRWIDERETEFPAAPSPAHIERVVSDPAEAEVAAAPGGAFFLVLTHSHEADLRIVQAILQRGDFGFLGLIGSRSKRMRFEHRLAERGIAPEQLARLTCPIGLPGVVGKEPAVIAVAVVAQLLSVPLPEDQD